MSGCGCCCDCGGGHEYGGEHSPSYSSSSSSDSSGKYNANMGGWILIIIAILANIGAFIPNLWLVAALAIFLDLVFLYCLVVAGVRWARNSANV